MHLGDTCATGVDKTTELYLAMETANSLGTKQRTSPDTQRSSAKKGRLMGIGSIGELASDVTPRNRIG